jgi:hypothetical protein
MFAEAPGKESWRSVLCVQCNLWELDEKNCEVQRVQTGGWNLTDMPIPPGKNTCIANHDMSMGTYRGSYPDFRANPFVFIL